MDTGDQRVVIEGLKQDNRKLHPELDIVKAEWLGFASKLDTEGKEKKYLSLIIDIIYPEVVNRLIVERIVIRSNLLYYDKWERNASLR